MAGFREAEESQDHLLCAQNPPKLNEGLAALEPRRPTSHASWDDRQLAPGLGPEGRGNVA